MLREAVINDRQKKVSKKQDIVLVHISAFMVALVFAFRGIHVGADTERYYKLFDNIRFGITEANIFDDGGFVLLTRILINFYLSNNLIIALYAFCFVFLMSVFAIRVNRDTLLVWIICVVSFVFVDLGINLIKAGLATSIALNAMLLKKYKRIGFIIAASFHISALIFIIADIVVNKVKQGYLIIALFLAIAFLYFGIFEGFLALLSRRIASDELNLLRYAVVNNFEYETGFRLDFILFSLLPLVYIFLFGRGSLDIRVVKVYMVLTIIFVCVMDFPFSNRIAYFSWILHGLLLTQGKLSRGLSVLYPAIFIPIGYVIYMKYLWV